MLTDLESAGVESGIWLAMDALGWIAYLNNLQADTREAASACVYISPTRYYFLPFKESFFFPIWFEVDSLTKCEVSSFFSFPG